MADRNIFIGYYLQIGKIKIAHVEPEVGCENCKTANGRDKFCSRCGLPHTDYDKHLTCKNLAGLLHLACDREEIDDATLDSIFDEFYIDGSDVIPRNDSDAGVSFYVNTEFLEISEPEINEGDARDYFQPVVDILNRYNISFELKRGILFYAY